MKRQALNLEALLRVPYVDPEGGVTLSPDGKQIAFSWNLSGQWEIYLLFLEQFLERDQSPLVCPRQIIVNGPGAKMAPRWSPDDQRLAYAMDLHGGEVYDIHIYDFATGEHTNLTPSTPDAILPHFCWSPDGRGIAFASDRSGCFNTYVKPLAGEETRPVLSPPYPDWRMHWSPDGLWLAIVAETEGQDYDTFIAPAPLGETTACGGTSVSFRRDCSTVEPRPIADEVGLLCARNVCWSPDSRWIAFVSPDRHSYANIGLYELTTGRVTWVTEGEGNKEFPAWSPDGRCLAYILRQGPLTALAVRELESGRVSTYQVEPGVHYPPRFTLDGEHLLFVFDNPRHPPDLWLLSLQPDSGQTSPESPFRQLTRSLPLEMDSSLFVMPSTIHYPGLDEQSVPALLYRPSGVQGPVPAVVYIHGGPNWLSQVTWDPLIQHIVSRGWAVLAPNYRGSTGYSLEWQLANRFDLGGVDTQDVTAGADYLVREGIADPARIAVTGRSWGGYLTMTCLTQYPDRWAAGSAVVPFLNWFTSHANSREDMQHWDRENFGDPEENYDLWYERSPFFFLDRITAPVQLICGAHDVRCPASESVQAHDALVAMGKTCDLALYPDEGHSFLRTENRVDAEKRRVAFLAEMLER